MNQYVERLLTCSLGAGLQLNSEVVQLYSTKEVCRITGLTRKALSIYVKRGIIPPPEKRGDGEYNKYNYYTDETVGKLVTVKTLVSLKIPLCEIKSILESETDTDTVNSQIASLLKQRNSINELIDRLVLFKFNNRICPVYSKSNAEKVEFDTVEAFTEYENKQLSERINYITNEKEG